MNQNPLKTPIEYLKGVGPKLGALLKSELNIFDYEDLIHFLPNRYIDKSKYYKIKEITSTATEVQIVGKITQFREIKQKLGSRLVAEFEDDTGILELVWFKGIRWLKERLKLNEPLVVSGKPSLFKQKLTLSHPDIENLEKHRIQKWSSLQPVYPLTEKLTSRNINQKYYKKLFKNLFTQLKDVSFEEVFSEELTKKFKLLKKKEALFNIHFPKDINRLNQAQYSLKFEELFYLQLAMLVKKRIRMHKYKSYAFEKVGSYFNQFYKEQLPFELTNAQKRVFKEIRNDLGCSVQMNRLLQGDVGSGKTIVALMAILIAIDNGFQATLMAPTEILAIQHFNSIKELIEPLGIDIKLLTGSTTKKNRALLHEALEEGKLSVLIGTHAIIEDRVRFKNLGLVIIDEQHRFGVAQRAKVYKKNVFPPHVLVMTATPIPRTLAMSLYGDLDVSVIDELPKGRKSIKTVHKRDANRLGVFSFIREEIKKGRQIYIVYPLIQESETLDFKDLMDGYESISRSFPLPEYKLSIVHGKMKAADKDFEMNRFAKGETQIMVATTVIEVGVNVPNASVMLIESAERFGLSQLHQLRGRVGRGAEQSYCILMTKDQLSNDGKLRIETLCKTNDGFEIAEVDLKLRGPGDIMGTQQSGILSLRIADLVKDTKVMEYVRYAAKNLLEKDPDFTKEENKNIRIKFEELQRSKLSWSRIS
ncbi:MAG: ATP-dependent DNA helicase RecG [Flavobacteriales bacterium]